MNKYRILVVDDEEDICEILQFNLESEGYTVDTAHSAEEALGKPISSYDLLLLDVMMGEISGFKLARMLKKEKKSADIPIIFLTAKDTENDVLTGFSLGADDYVSKPFSLREVIARVRAVLGRVAPKRQETPVSKCIRYRAMNIDLQQKKVTIDNRPLGLTRKETEILLLLIQHQSRVFTREELLESVWPDDVYVLGRTVDVNITRLRKKLGEYGKCIVTRLGYGYAFEAGDSDEVSVV
ncbi:MAG: response regulator transcription factor [Prevotellaceae bacterium]|nr:response regulator transcription factor [Prevotellaceae bacterium]